MKELVVISGKGGTGKTSLTAAFAALSEHRVLCDADVDAADLHLLMAPETKTCTDFVGGSIAEIDPEKCTQCGLCREMCRFSAISEDFIVDAIACEGCGVCVDFCPEQAIDFPAQVCGQWFISNTRYGPMVHARLGIAEENSGKLVTLIRQEAKKSGGEEKDEAWLRKTIKMIVVEMLGQDSPELRWAPRPPMVILVVGVNGVGKTTTIAKLAGRFRKEAKSVLLVAGDTFRAAAIEQLEIWAGRTDSEFIKSQAGADPAAIVFDAVHSARTRGTDVVIIDTAGRLHTKTNLMKELEKISRILQREIPEAPHETLLVVDASTGQNGLAQAKQFTEATPVTGLVLTKMDGTAKGGVILSVHRELDLPVKFIGLGEGMDDLEDFSTEAFVQAILPAPENGE